MEEQVFIDGIGQVSIIGGTVRLDLVAYSATEKAAKDQPALVFRQRLVMSVDGFMRAAEKIQETVATLQRLSQQQRPRPAAVPDIAPGDPMIETPPASSPAEAHPAITAPASVPRRPFP